MIVMMVMFFNLYLLHLINVYFNFDEMILFQLFYKKKIKIFCTTFPPNLLFLNPPISSQSLISITARSSSLLCISFHRFVIFNPHSTIFHKLSTIINLFHISSTYLTSSIHYLLILHTSLPTINPFFITIFPPSPQTTENPKRRSVSTVTPVDFVQMYRMRSTEVTSHPSNSALPSSVRSRKVSLGCLGEFGCFFLTYYYYFFNFLLFLLLFVVLILFLF